MRKFFLILLITFCYNNLFSKDEKQTNGVFLLTNNGIATVPLFSLGKPASIFIFEHTSSKFKFVNESSINLSTGSAWFINNWIHYRKQINNFEFLLGGGYILDFPQNSTVTHYTIFEPKILYKSKQVGSFEFKIQFARPINIDLNNGVKGTYSAFIYSKRIEANKFMFNTALQICNINFVESIKGFSSSATVNVIHKKTGLFAGTQGIKPMIKNIDPSWNLSLGISRKL